MRFIILSAILAGCGEGDRPATPADHAYAVDSCKPFGGIEGKEVYVALGVVSVLCKDGRSVRGPRPR